MIAPPNAALLGEDMNMLLLVLTAGYLLFQASWVFKAVEVGVARGYSEARILLLFILPVSTLATAAYWLLVRVLLG
jgi:hypothetical protein